MEQLREFLMNISALQLRQIFVDWFPIVMLFVLMGLVFTQIIGQRKGQHKKYKEQIDWQNSYLAEVQRQSELLTRIAEALEKR